MAAELQSDSPKAARNGLQKRISGTPIWYKGTMVPLASLSMPALQTPEPPRGRARPDGVRLEKRLLKVLKGLAEYLDLSLGDLLEGIALHALENKPPFEAAP